MVHRRLVVTGTVMAVAVGFTGCDHGGSESEPTRPPSKASSATPSLSAKEIAERAAVAAYRGMWDAWVEAGKTSDPDAPALRTYTGGDALKLIVSVLATNRHNKQIALGKVAIDPVVTEVKPVDVPITVTITDCVDAGRWLMYRSSGGLVDDVPGGRHGMTAAIARTGGTWKVTTFKLGKVGTC